MFDEVESEAVHNAEGGRWPRAMRALLVWLLAPAYVLAGVNHFRDADFYLAMMPPWLPWHEALVIISGVAEIALGILVLPPATRRLAGYGLVALLVAVFPANVQMLLDGHDGVPVWALWIRLPLQAVLIAWALYATRCPRPVRPRV